MRRFVVALNVLIFSGLASCIHQTGRRSKIPYEPDHRIPIKVPDGKDNLSENWSRLDSGKYLRSLQKDLNMRDANRPTGPDTITGNSSDVCFTKNCVLASASLLESMDETVNPCQDFYSFVCGSYIDKAIIPQHKGVFSTLGEIAEENAYRIHKLLTVPKENVSSTAKQLRDFYQSCLDVDTMEKKLYEPLFTILGDIGVVTPMLAFNAVRFNEKDPEKVLETLLINFLGDSPLFGLDYSRDFQNSSSKNVLTIYQPNMRLPPALYHRHHPSFWPVMKYYEQFYVAAATELRKHVPGLDLSDSDLLRNIVDMLGLEVKIGSILANKITMQDTMNKITFAKFDLLLATRNDSIVNVAGVVKSVIQKLTGVEITDETEIIVLHANYFQQLVAALSQTTAEELTNYLTFQHMVSMATATTKYMRSLNAEFQSIFTGVNAEPPRWDYCVEKSISYFGAKVSHLFVEDGNGFETKAETEKMMVELRKSFNTIIEESDWMDEETRSKALEKLQSITAVDIVAGDQLTDEGVANVYQNLPPMKSETFLENVFDLQKFWTKKELKRIFEVPKIMGDIDFMGFDTTLVNAMYSPDMNLIWVPNGIQRRTVFAKNRIQALNYGPLGSIIGHELTHGFDNNGAQYDATGNFKNWWSQETGRAFEEKQKCFIDQYNKYDYPILSKIPDYRGPTHVNGVQTLGENIADNGGMRESFQAYKQQVSVNGEASLPGLSKYTSDQLYFMSYARVWCETKTVSALVSQLMMDPHPPAQVRVHAVMSNSPDFQAAFNCAAEDPMVAKPRCKIW